MATPWNIRAGNFWKNYLRPFLFIAIVLMAVRSSVADWNDVPTGSMKPSIIEGDRIFVNKLAYDLKVPFTTWHIGKWGDPKRGDIVVFFSPADGKRLVKRVAAVPGDVIELRDEQLILNGVAAEYKPLDIATVNQVPAQQQANYVFASETIHGRSHPVMALPAVVGPLRSYGPRKLEADEYFMLGDNRDNSADSRVFGPVKRDLIVGRASAVVVSLDLNDYYMPRWGRFFKSLP